MENSDNPFVKCLGILSGFILALILLLLLAGGCTKRVYVPVEKTITRTDTLTHRERILSSDSSSLLMRILQSRLDSVTRIERIYESRIDSMAARYDSAGQFTGFDYWHFRDRSNETTQTNTRLEQTNSELKEENTRLLSVIDSLKAVRRDSVEIEKPFPVEVEKEVNKLHWWQKGLMTVGVAGIILLAVLIVRWIRRFKR